MRIRRVLVSTRSSTQGEEHTRLLRLLLLLVQDRWRISYVADHTTSFLLVWIPKYAAAAAVVGSGRVLLVSSIYLANTALPVNTLRYFVAHVGKKKGLG